MGQPTIEELKAQVDVLTRHNRDLLKRVAELQRDEHDVIRALNDRLCVVAAQNSELLDLVQCVPAMTPARSSVHKDAVDLLSRYRGFVCDCGYCSPRRQGCPCGSYGPCCDSPKGVSDHYCDESCEDVCEEGYTLTCINCGNSYQR